MRGDYCAALDTHNHSVGADQSCPRLDSLGSIRYVHQIDRPNGTVPSFLNGLNRKLTLNNLLDAHVARWEHAVLLSGRCHAGVEDECQVSRQRLRSHVNGDPGSRKNKEHNAGEKCARKHSEKEWVAKFVHAGAEYPWRMTGGRAARALRSGNAADTNGTLTHVWGAGRRQKGYRLSHVRGG